MKNKRHLAAAALVLPLLLLFVSCAGNSSGTLNLMSGIKGENWPESQSNMDQSLQSAVKDFSWTLFRRSLEEEGNVLVSPTSVYLALAMTLNGAKGETLDAMKGTLFAEKIPHDLFNEESRNWVSLLREESEKTKVSVANSIWFRKDYPVHKDFLQMNGKYYNAGAMGMDFSDPKAASVINEWVKANTQGAIEKIVEEIRADTMLYLINAVYFKSDWKEPFLSADTNKGLFQGTKGNVEIDFMHRTGDMTFLKGEGYEGVLLPYESPQYAFFAILPLEGMKKSEWLTRLETTGIGLVVENGTIENVTLTLPKFEMRYEKSLNQILSDMGMGLAFDQKADFSGMNQEGVSNLYIGEVFHKTYARVNEKGTEAAAVTSVDMRLTSMPLEGKILNFDRPFLFGIWNKETQTPLFLGWMETP